MQYCQGGSLENLILQQKNFQQKLMIFSMIIAGVQQLHRNNIVHRDLKPSNILFKNNIVKIIDLGLAKSLKGERITVTNQLAGSYFYIAPENLQDNFYNQKVDVWALGLIFLQLMSGKLLFQILKGLEHPSKRLKQFPSQQDMKSINNSKIKKIICQMLKKNPNERTQIKNVWQQIKQYYPTKLIKQQQQYQILTKRKIFGQQDQTVVKNQLQQQQLIQIFKKNKWLDRVQCDIISHLSKLDLSGKKILKIPQQIGLLRFLKELKILYLRIQLDRQIVALQKKYKI